MLEGGGSYFDFDGLNEGSDPSQFTEDGEYVTELPSDYYATTTYTDKIIEYIESNRGDGQPYFAYVAHQAPHDPFQMPDEWLRRYKGWYDCGWDSVRTDRLTRMIDIGVLASGSAKGPRLWYVPGWDKMTPAAQTTTARKMELYASMVEYMDQEIGRLIAYLDDTGQLDNTYILFFSDNGPESSDALQTAMSAPPFALGANWLARTYALDYASWGRRGSFISYGTPWAQVSATPFFGVKGTLLEGGIRSPLIVVTPDGQGQGNINREALLHVTDIAPTLLELAGIPQPTTFQGRDVLPMQGLSWASLMRGDVDSPRGNDDWLAFELFGQRAVRQGPWKAVSLLPPLGPGDWQLFNLEQDLGEQRDVSSENPQIMARMIDHWDTYVETNNVILPNRNPFEQMEKQLPARPQVLDDNWPPGAEPNWGAEEDEPLTCYVRK